MGPRQKAQAALFHEFSLEDHVPQDHLLRSIDPRKRLLFHLYEKTVARCTKVGFLSGQGFAVDACLISADVQKQNSSIPDDWAARETNPNDAPRAVRPYLDTLCEVASVKVVSFLRWPEVMIGRLS